MIWCLLAVLLRWMTCSRIWGLFARWMPVGKYGMHPVMLLGLGFYGYIINRELDWWLAGPRRQRFLALAHGGSDDAGQRQGGDDGNHRRKA